MTRPDSPDIRCAGCGRYHSREFIRCALCKTPTKESARVWAEEAERLANRKRGLIAIPLLALAAWVIVFLIWRALT